MQIHTNFLQLRIDFGHYKAADCCVTLGLPIKYCFYICFRFITIEERHVLLIRRQLYSTVQSLTTLSFD